MGEVMKLHRIIPALAFALSMTWTPSLAQETDDSSAPSAEKDSTDKKEKKKKKSKDKEDEDDSEEGYVAKKSQVNWARTEAALKSLGAAILCNVKGDSPKEVREFVEKPQNRLLLAQWMLAYADVNLNVETVEKERKQAQNALERAQERLRPEESMLDAMKKEADRKEQLKRLEPLRLGVELAQLQATRPWSMADLQESKRDKKMLETVARDMEWMEQLAFTGECIMPGRAIALLASIAEENPDILKNRHLRDIATATAIEYSKHQWNFGKGLMRADYFIRHSKDKRLNSTFYKLPFWQLRIVCGAKTVPYSHELEAPGNAHAAEVPSMEWALDNIHIPAERYTGSCWRCGYKLFNQYAQSVHGADYRNPFIGMYDRNFHQLTYEVGGVCGGLSHFGAYAAVANGIPALTTGEPGHCSFVVLIGDTWTPAYSLSWERGCHWQPWLGNYRYSCLHMHQELYAQENEEDNRISNAYRVMAHIFRDRRNDKMVLSCFRNAVSAQPLNYLAWKDYADYVLAQHANKLDAWYLLHDDLCTYMVPRYPEVASEFLQMYVYENMIKAGIPAKRGQICIQLFWSAIDTMGPDKWHLDKVLMAQARLLSNGEDKDVPSLTTAYACMMSNVAHLAGYPPHAIAMGEAMADAIAGRKKDGGSENAMGTAANEAAASELTGKMKEINALFMNAGKSKRGDAEGALLLAAERAHDVVAFQTLGKQLFKNKGGKVGNVPAYDGFDDQCLSRGGVLFAGSYGEKDNPAEHWGVLEDGGFIETAAEANPWVALRLARDAFVNGVVVISPQDNASSQDNIRLQISETGKDGSWQDIGTPKGKCTGRISNFDLRGENPKVKYLRVLRKGGTDSLRINGIYVFGRPAA